MARPETGLSLELERSMNMQVRMMTFEEYLRHMEIIDKHDDLRRDKSLKLNALNKNKQREFMRRRKSLYKISDYNLLIEELIKLDKEVTKFNNKFNTQRKELDDDELHYEAIDDNHRKWILEYTVKCRNELRIENNKTEDKLIMENLRNKKK